MPPGSLLDEATEALMVGGVERPHLALRLLDRFELTQDGRPVAVSENVQRLLAFLAVSGRPQRRSAVASSLWMDTPDDRAAANLRTALWKVRKVNQCLIDIGPSLLALAPGLPTDRSLLIAQVKRLVGDEDVAVDDLETGSLEGELLPMWDDEWVLFERERLRHLRIHGLEALTARLCRLGRFAEAVDAALMAVAADSLRESAQRVLIEAYLAEGNWSEARRQLDQYSVVLHDALGVRPSPSLEQLVTPASRP